MKFKFRQNEKKFLRKWVLANSIGWPVGFIVALILSYGIVNLFYPKETNFLLGICIGAVIAFSQWFILKRFFKISVWWIFAAAIGIGLPFIIAVLFFELSGYDISITKIEIIDQSIAFFIGGLITGLLQFHSLKSFAVKYTWWIIVSALAWGIGWYGIVFGGVILGLITGIAMLRFHKIPIESGLDKEM